VRRRFASLPQLGPAAIFYLLFFVVPLSIFFVYSFWTVNGFDIVPGFTLANYLAGATSELYLAILVRTITVGLLTACVVVPIAYALAYLMRFVFEKRARMLLDLVLISMFSGYLVRIYAWRTILGKDGLLNSALMQLHLIDQPITFLIYSQWATVIVLVDLLIPLALLSVYSSMSNVSREHLEGARDLGSSRVHLHRTIVVPMILPGLNTAFAISFILAAGDYVVPSMVGGTQGIMIGNVVADQFNGLAANWPLGAALAYLVIGSVIAVYLVTSRVIRMATRW
jgi:spermidine/putrescine transport system permease protein